jgi:hypothetical protein
MFAVVALALLAVVETAQALVAPSRAPTDADWAAAASEVRAGFRPGDLIVAAPEWAEPLVRMHLGDLIPIPVAARMDDARFGRIWEIAQRGARAEAVWSAGGAVVHQRKLGALTVNRVERPAAVVSFDFLERWQEAEVARRPGAGGGAEPTPCPWQGDRFVCPGASSVHRELVEVDTRIRRALLASPPAGGGVLSLSFPAVPLGRELAVAAGLHDVWARKYATGTVDLKVFVGGAEVLATAIANRSGWRVLVASTAARAGQVAPVRFEISSREPALRHFALAAEAR